MAKADTKTEEEELPKPKGKRMLLLFIGVAGVVLLLGGGVLVWLLTSKPVAEQAAGHGGEAGAVVEAEKDAHPPVYVKLDQFTVNLSDGESYLQCEITLKVAESEVQEKIQERLPEVRDSLLRLLSSQSPDELATMEGKDKLANGVKREVNEVLGIKTASEGVQKVLFPAFIIQ